MFSQKTVLVLGAGAGQEVGMRVGTDLMTDIARDVNIAYDVYTMKSGEAYIDVALRRYAKKHSGDVNSLFQAGRSIARGVELAGSIDNYLENHRQDEAVKLVGKVGIVYNIVKYEKNSDLHIDLTNANNGYRNPSKVKSAWFHKFMQLLGEGLVAGESLAQIFENLVVVSFNYDRCIEHFLWRALQDRFGLRANEAAELMETLPVYHPYGRIGALPWQKDARQGSLAFGGDPHDPEPDLLGLAENIRTYNEEVTEREQLEKIHSRIVESRRIIFLGFHFHNQNMKLITPADYNGRKNIKHAYATVLGRHPPERDRISAQIEALCQSSSNSTSVHQEHAPCRALLDIWGTSFVN